ncbi:hypothetical protein Tco_0194222 [Tanacetum coccineum]
MAPTSIELLQSRFIRSVKYFCTSLVNGQHNLSLTASPQVLPQVDAAAVEPEPPLVGHVFVHEPQLQLETGLVFEHEPPVEHDSAHTINDFDVAIEEQSESVPMFIREELVAEHHAIITSVQFIETVIVGDPSFVVKELIAVKKMIIAIEKIIKSKNDDMSEDSVAKQFVQKEVGSCDEKAQSAILDVFIGEVSCDKFVRNIYDGESSKNNDMCEDYVANESVHKEVKAGDGKTNMNELESDDESVDTLLVSPFPYSDNDSDDGEVLNELIEYENVGMLRREKVINSFNGDDLAFQCMIGFRKFVAYFDPFLPMNIITRKAYNTIMVEGLESTGENLVVIVRDVYVFIGSFTYIMDFVLLEDIGEFIQINKAEVVMGKPFRKITKLKYDYAKGLMSFNRIFDNYTFQMPRTIPRFKRWGHVSWSKIPPILVLSQRDLTTGSRMRMKRTNLYTRTV